MNYYKKDCLKGNHSFKKWLSIMWQGGYLLTFIFAFATVLLQLQGLPMIRELLVESYKDGVILFGLIAAGIFMPLLICIYISYKYFYKYWSKLKNDSKL